LHSESSPGTGEHMAAASISWHAVHSVELLAIAGRKSVSLDSPVAKALALDYYLQSDHAVEMWSDVLKARLAEMSTEHPSEAKGLADVTEAVGELMSSDGWLVRVQLLATRDYEAWIGLADRAIGIRLAADGWWLISDVVQATVAVQSVRSAMRGEEPYIADCDSGGKNWGVGLSPDGMFAELRDTSQGVVVDRDATESRFLDHVSKIAQVPHSGATADNMRA